MMERLQFHISYKCVNQCIFCNERERMLSFGPSMVCFDDVKRILILMEKRGFRHVTFTGGEPTLVKDLAAILKTAKKLNYTTYITTNGVKMSSRRYCEAIFPYLDEICLSIHGATSIMHDVHTQNSGSFQKMTETLEHVNRWSKKIKVFINTVVTVYNVQHLPEIVRFVLSKCRVTTYILSHIAPEGDGSTNFPLLVPFLTQAGYYSDAIVKLGMENDSDVIFFGFPLCILKHNFVYSNDLYWDSKTTVEKYRKNRKVFLREVKEYTPTRDRIKIKRCAACVLNEFCGGIFKRYIEQFGDKEIQPVLA